MVEQRSCIETCNSLCLSVYVVVLECDERAAIKKDSEWIRRRAGLIRVDCAA